MKMWTRGIPFFWALVFLQFSAAVRAQDTTIAVPADAPTIAAALVQARAIRAADPLNPIAIRVAAGDYPLLAPLVIDVPGLTLAGEVGTIVHPDAAFAAHKPGCLVVVTANVTSVRGLDLRLGGLARCGILVDRAQVVVLEGNSIGGAGQDGIIARSSTVAVHGNSITQQFSGVLILGGSQDAPGVVDMTGNVGTGNIYATCLIGDGATDSDFGAGPAPFASSVQLIANVSGNDFSGNGSPCRPNGIPGFGGGVQVIPTTQDTSVAALVSTRIQVNVQNNQLDNNYSYGLIIDSDHSLSASSPRFFPSTMVATVDARVAGNHFAQNHRNSIMLGMAFWATPIAQDLYAANGVGMCQPAPLSVLDIFRLTPYLNGSTYEVTYDGNSGEVDYDNPEVTGAGNTVRLNGALLTGGDHLSPFVP